MQLQEQRTVKDVIALAGVVAVLGISTVILCMAISGSTSIGRLGQIVLSVLAAAVLAGVYFVPTIIAAPSHMPHVGSIAVVNVFLGFTYVGWVAVAGKRT